MLENIEKNQNRNYSLMFLNLKNRHKLIRNDIHFMMINKITWNVTYYIPIDGINTKTHYGLLCKVTNDWKENDIVLFYDTNMKIRIGKVINLTESVSIVDLAKEIVLTSSPQKVIGKFNVVHDKV